VSLSRPFDQTVTIDFSTADGTAAAVGDYAAVSGTLTFAPGELSKTITVVVNGDMRDEHDETFLINLTNPVNAGLLDGQGLVTILDNDSPPSLSINDVSVVEGAGGVRNAVFTVTLTAMSEKTISLRYATADGTAKTSNNDYVAAAGTLAFAPGETVKTIAVQVKGDKTKEATEKFLVNLSSPENVVAADAQAVGTIVNDDPLPTLNVNNVSRIEGQSGVTFLVFTVTLSAPAPEAVTVQYATADGTAKTSDGDYVAAAGTLTFAAGETTKTFTVQIKGDKKKEAKEAFFVKLRSPLNAALGTAQGTGTILNDD
jgi:large repetitive protein